MIRCFGVWHFMSEPTFFVSSDGRYFFPENNPDLIWTKQDFVSKFGESKTETRHPSFKLTHRSICQNNTPDSTANFFTNHPRPFNL